MKSIWPFILMLVVVGILSRTTGNTNTMPFFLVPAAILLVAGIGKKEKV